MDDSQMPKLQPIPIPTKNQPFFKSIKGWIFSIRNWKVVEDWSYELPDNEATVVIPKGFIFDGASIPRPLWGILSPTGLLLIPGLIHDYGYRHNYLWALDSENKAFKYKEGAGKKYWDSLFMKVGKDVNGMKLLDFIAWIAVSFFGGFAWRSNRKRNEEELKPAQLLNN